MVTFQAQTEFMKLHKEQFDKYVTAQKKDSEAKEHEVENRIEEIRKQMMTERDTEKEEIIAAHAEEVGKLPGLASQLGILNVRIRRNSVKPVSFTFFLSRCVNCNCIFSPNRLCQ